MGVLNVTPDSFFEGGCYNTPEKAVAHALQLEDDGAHWIDIGGESTRPPQFYGEQQSFQVTEREELQRVIPAIAAVKAAVNTPLSIDTRRAAVAEKAVAAGAMMINDVTGFEDPAMRTIAAESGVLVCVCHMQGTLETMQDNPHYPHGVVPTLITWFGDQIEKLAASGVANDKIILDPGIGFGKTVADNLEIIHNVQKLKSLGFPVLLGTSRKSFLSKILEKPAQDLLPATLAVNTYAAMQGVDMLRVHDVAENSDILKTVAAFAGRELTV